ncbi:prepilin-type N-terminal cleavage/methylation domain-containing protein [Allopseudospirillum japonicum]|uniref:Prepilin-type N-terminal cleavage/methylation domain-containing protein n=1 Tax=Allopseudospirillum japonicum TaxID=64971 RepID=A0A1H6TTP4_9GAMM|nr:pilin [Allopseudospirillum japonicum]SEI83391.1 prepilin-type N-terminal cleavage/methylation domain-containing protein [Allopseudospirillum japonicum]
MLSLAPKTMRGFSILELMMVSVILAILASMAVLTYMEYTDRAKITEALIHLGQVRSEASVFYQSMGHFPNQLSELGVNAIHTKYIQSVSLHQPSGNQSLQIRAYLDPVRFFRIDAQSNGIMLSSAPSASDGSLQWRCQSTSIQGIKAHILPGHCRP